MNKLQQITLTHKKTSEIQTGSRSNKSVFERLSINPLTFTPDETELEITLRARGVLSLRSEDEVNQIACFTRQLIDFGEAFALNIHSEFLKKYEGKTSVTLYEAGSLFILSQFFKLDVAGLSKVRWYEVFAVLALTQVAELMSAKLLEEPSEDASEFAKAEWLVSRQLIKELPLDILECSARLSCVYYYESLNQEAVTKGGKSKAAIIEPLKQDVVKAYVASYSHLSAKRAGEAIAEEFEKAANPNRFKSGAEDIALQFAKWIRLFKQGKLKMSSNF